MQKPKSMDQLKPNFGNRSHFCFTCQTKIWHMLQRGYCRVGNINLFYASSHFYFLSDSFSSSSTYQILRLIPSFYFLHLPVRFQVLFLFDFPLPIPIPSTDYFHHILLAFLPLVYYNVYRHLFRPSSPTSCLALFPWCVPNSDDSYLTKPEFNSKHDRKCECDVTLRRIGILDSSRWSNHSMHRAHIFCYSSKLCICYRTLLVLTLNHLTPNGHYMGRTAQPTSRCCILYIYSTNIRTEYFKHAA